MSKNVKIILIIVGILAFLGVACVGGFAFLGYYFVDHEGIINSAKEGEEFGKTTDHQGCQTKVLSIIKPLPDTDINEVVKATYFFDSCLETSRPSPNFCDGLPSDWTDIMNDDKAKDAECAKLGFRHSNACRQVMKKKLDFCDKKR